MRLMNRLAVALIAFFPALFCAGYDVTIFPTNLNNSARAGFDATNQSITLTPGPSQYSYSITTNAPAAWMVVSSGMGGVSNGYPAVTVTVSYASSGLASGVSNGILAVVTSNNWSPYTVQTQMVSVTLNVVDFSVSPTNFTHAFLKGFSMTDQTFEVSAGGGAMSFTASSDAAWLSVSSASGYVSGATNTLTNIYDTIALPGADYEGHVTVATAEGGGITGVVRVAMRVYATPVLEASPSVIWQLVDKGGNATGESFNVRNASAAPVVGMEYWPAVTDDPDNIIQGVLPTDGISTGQYNTVSISFRSLSGFDAGTYTAVVEVAATNYGAGYEGHWSGTTNVNVVIVVAGPEAPAISASKGDYEDRVALNWPAVGGSVTYNILRHTTFDPNYAETIVSGLTVTNYNDTTVSPGSRYYYWLQCINTYGQAGTNSVADTGYRRLAAPGGLFASDGEYTNKVVVNWAVVNGAGSYYVYRGTGGSVGAVYHTAGTEYEDNNVTEGVTYTYYVQATNSIGGSVLSAGETGYVLGRPTVLSASDGDYVDKVVIIWNAVNGATTYEVWRSTQTLTPPYGGGAKIAETASTSYNDLTVTAGTKYYYWLKSRNVTGLSGFSAREEGYPATVAVDLSLWGLVVQPRRIGLGGKPRVVSFRLANNGGAALAGDNGTVQMEFYASVNNVFGDGDDQTIGTINQQLTLATGSSGIFRVDGGNITLPGIAGAYYLFLRLKPAWPSTLAPAGAGGWNTRRAQALAVSAAGPINYQAMNDYDGDGVSDLMVRGGGLWDGRSMDGYEFARNYAFGGDGVVVMGDYDGDCRTDMVIYDESGGFWQARFSGSGYANVTGYFGGPGFCPVPGDYNGDGNTEVTTYDTINSLWYALKVGDGRVMWGTQFGNLGYEPVMGDYDGDGVWDLAVYNENSGLWYIRTVAGTLLLVGGPWGGSGFSPVPGDYDGDGIWDFAVYEEATRCWFIVNMQRKVIAYGILFGAAGYRPVAGDFDGDGISDLAMYNSTTGKWYIRTVGGLWLLLDSTWGGAGRKAVGEVD